MYRIRTESGKVLATKETWKDIMSDYIVLRKQNNEPIILEKEVEDDNE